MNLVNYIQNGKPCRNSYLSLIFGVIALTFSGIIYFLSNHLLGMPEMEKFLDSLPVIQIENEQVISPKDFIFEQKIPFGQSYVLIDTTQEKPSKTVESGVMLTKTNIVLSIGGQIQMYPLPQEKTTINTSFVKKLLAQGIQNMAIALAVVLFILLWLGFMLTLILEHLLTLLIQKKAPKDMLKRSACIGWVSVIALNIVLLGFGYTLSFIVAIPVAVAIGLFCLFNSSAFQ